MQYTVKSGDTISSIATKFKMTVDELVSTNKLIVPGQVLQVKDPALVYENGLPRPGVINPSAVYLQRQLKRVGYLTKNHKEVTLYDDMTQKGVAALFRHMPNLGGGPAITEEGWAYLSRAATGSAVNLNWTSEDPPVVDSYLQGLPVPNESSPSAVALQRELKRVGYLSKTHKSTSLYDAMTQKAVSALHRDKTTLGSGPVLGRSAWNYLIRAKAGTAVNLPPQPGDQVTVPVAPKIKIKFYDIGPGGTVTANKVVQDALNKEFGGVTVDGDYGPQTVAAYKKWQEKVGEEAKPWDGSPGKISIVPLGEKYRFTLDFTPPPAGTEPAQNYTRTYYNGVLVNQRTKDMLIKAATLYGGNIPMSQGSYNAGGVAASAGTHDGGGVVDIGSASNSLLIALKKVGFAAWIRTPAEGFSYHIHACAIGDREMAGSAKNQITSFYNGRNALVSNARDSHPDRYYPEWTRKYGAPV